MTASAQNIVRGIRSDGVRDLVRSAIAQGFDVSMSGKGHVRVRPPNGGYPPVYVSASSTSGDWHEVKRVRAGLVRVGFDPYFDARATRRAARAAEPIVAVVADELMRPKQEGKPMPTPMPPPADDRRPHATLGDDHPGYRTGKTVFVTDETIDVDGVALRLRRRADGTLVGWTPPTGDMPSRLRTWSVGVNRLQKSAPPRTPDEQRAELIANVRQWIADGMPPKKQVPAAWKAAKTANAAARHAAEEGTEVPTNGHVDIAEREPIEPAVAERAAAARDADMPAVSWLSVRIDPADYPLARALAELVETIAPAVQALERSGRKAAADILVESVEMTEVERELVRLWQDVHGRPYLEHGRRPADDAT